MGEQNTAKKLFDLINTKCLPNTFRPELGAFTDLRREGDLKVEFSIEWYKHFTVTFRPQTIGVKYNLSDKHTKESKQVSKSYPLDQDNLLDTILDLIK